MADALNKVLLVDDDTVTNLMHKRQISRLGLAHQIDVVTDGQAALDYLGDCLRQGTPSPELILLDINMPRMNGFEFLQEYARLPDALRHRQAVVMVSTSTLRRDRSQADEDGSVVSYETKPLLDADLQRIVRGCHSTEGVSAS